MSFERAYNPVIQFFHEGKPVINGSLCTFLAGTDTPVATFNDRNGHVENPVCIPLDNNGCTPNIWLKSGVAYKFIVRDSNGVNVFIKDYVRSQITFVVDGEGAIASEESTVDGVTTIRVYIKPNSIGRDLLKNHHNLVPDTNYLQFKDFGGNVVVTLCNSLKDWLEAEGYVP